MQDSGGSVRAGTHWNSRKVGQVHSSLALLVQTLFLFWADLLLFLPRPPILTDEANRTSLFPKQLSKTTMYNPLSSSPCVCPSLCVPSTSIAVDTCTYQTQCRCVCSFSGLLSSVEPLRLRQPIQAFSYLLLNIQYFCVHFKRREEIAFLFLSYLQSYAK